MHNNCVMLFFVQEVYAGFKKFLEKNYFFDSPEISDTLYLIIENNAKL